jgi:hypothetical protein
MPGSRLASLDGCGMSQTLTSQFGGGAVPQWNAASRIVSLQASRGCGRPA